VSLTIEFDGGNAEDSPFARFSFLRAATAWADEVGPVVLDALKAEAPVAPDNPLSGAKGGRLKGSIRYEREVSEGSVSAVFTANTPYAGYVLEGTGPHVIAASAARSLQFMLDGAVTYRRRVNHPGTKANPFNERAVIPLTPELRASFAEAMQESAEGA
jgi:Bacteriophage HK97-gp10, putative tail-component